MHGALSNPSRSSDGTDEQDWQWALIAAAPASILCALKLNLDLWADEVYTLYHFAQRPIAEIVSDFSAPNNHILFTLVIRPFWLLSTKVVALRLPALLISVATLMALFRLGLVLGGRSIAVWATLALGLNVMFLTHTMQLRGYGLSMLLATSLANLAASPTPSWRRGLLIALLGAALLYTVPTNLLFLAPLAIWSVATQWKHGRQSLDVVRAATPWMFAGLLALALYLPVVDQLAAQRGSQPASTRQLLQLPLDVFWAAGHDVWPLGCLALIVLVLRRARHVRVAWTMPSLVATLLVGPFLVAAIMRMTPFVRNFCPLLPFLALGIAWLLDQAFGWRDDKTVRPHAPRRTLWVAGLLVAVLLPAVLLYPARLRRCRQERFAQDGYYNYYAADFEPSCIVRYLRERLDPHGSYLVCYAQADHYNLVDPLARAGFPIPPHHRAAQDSRAPEFYVILPPRPDYTELEKTCGLAPAQVARLAVVKRCGYYELRRANSQVAAPRGSPR